MIINNMLKQLYKRYRQNEFRILLGIIYIIALYGLWISIINGTWWWIIPLCFGISRFSTIFSNSIAQHRYFTHRSFDTTPFKEKVLAWLTVISCTGSPIQYARNHRHHHKVADTEKDWHSPHVDGPWHVLFGTWEFRSLSWYIERGGISPRDLIAIPTVRFIHDNYYLIWYGMLFVAWLIDWNVLAYGLALPTLITHFDYHGFQNWSNHVNGTRTYDTPDHSKNNKWLYPFMAGECWHNNHHAKPWLYDFGIQPHQKDWIARFLERYFIVDGPATQRGKYKSSDL